MEKQISFSEGLVSQPYSDVSPDGQLSTMHNLEVHAGGVRPSLLLGKQFGLGGELVFIHKTGYYTHYLFKDASGNLRYKDSEDGQDDDTYYDEIGTDSNQAEVSEDSNLVASASNIENLKNIAATGNILTFLCDDKELQYAIWREDKYVFLGVMPELEVTFALEGEEKMHVVQAGSDDDPISYIEGLNSNAINYEYVSGAAKEFENRYCNAEDGGFVYPFYVRAAWKMYDGTFTQFTSPILMIPNTRWPCVILPQGYGNVDSEHHLYKKHLVAISDERPSGYSQWDYGGDLSTENVKRLLINTNGYVIANVMKLLCKLKNDIPEEWEGLIVGLEIMTSQPMPAHQFDYHAADEIEGSEETLIREALSVSYGKKNNSLAIDKLVPVGYSSDYVTFNISFEDESLATDGFTMRFDETKEFKYWTANWVNDGNAEIISEEYSSVVKSVVLQNLTEDEIRKKYSISDGFAFFHLETIPSIEFSTDFKTVKLKEKQYDSITTNKVDYKDTWSHVRFFPKNFIEYNGRLNLYNNKVKYWVPKDPALIQPYIDDTPITGLPSYMLDVYVKVHRSGQIKVIRIGNSEICSYYFEPLYYLFIPNTEVVSVIFVNKDLGPGYGNLHPYEEIVMDKSATMDGVYFYSNSGYRPEYYDTNVDGKYFEQVYGQYITDDDIDYQSNTIYTSYVDNPYIYTAKGLNQIGGGRIIKLAAMTKPLSEGQMGGFPLIAFCTDGNYALEVIKSGEDAGLYEGVTPMRPDVCINADSILGIEEGIFFVSQRGLMLMQNNDALLLSEKIDGVKDLFGNEGDNEYYDEIGADDIGNSSTHAGGFNSLRPREYIEECMPAWDYTNSRLLLLRKGFKEAYVFKADDKTWSSVKLPASVKTVLSSYPFSYIQFNGDGELTDGTVVVLDDDYNYTDGEEKDGIIVTRPMKMDTLRLKRINEFALHGNFAGKQKLTIYGSNDLKNWHQVGVTKRRHVGMMPGYFFKFWRFKIETSLKENENISGMEVRYNIKNNGMR